MRTILKVFGGSFGVLVVVGLNIGATVGAAVCIVYGVLWCLRHFGVI